MEARIKLSKFCHKSGACFYYVIGQAITSNVIARVSILSHYATMGFFYNESPVKRQKNIIEHGSCGLPTKNWPTECFLARPSITLFSSSAKCFFKPIDKYFIARSYFKHTMPTIIASVFMLFCFAYVKTSFSIYNASKICPLLGSLAYMKNNLFCHNEPFVYNSIVLNEGKVHAERLNERGHLTMACESLNSNRKMEREIRRGFPAYNYR
jgi:hypothetical protein